LGRSIKELITGVSWLEHEGIGLKSQQEVIDTTLPSGKLTFHIFAALAEFERQLIQERTQAGLNAARARGRVGGPPKALAAGKQEIYEMMGISKPTLCAYVRQVQSASSLDDTYF